MEYEAFEHLEKSGLMICDDVTVPFAESLLRLLGKVDPARNGFIEPVDKEDARPNSLSESYGLQQFPWHTDGALSTNPPRYIAMLAVDVESYVPPTELLDLVEGRSGYLSTMLRGCVLTTEDASGHRRSLKATEMRAGKRLHRWDTRVCSPYGPRSADVVFEMLPPTGVIEWADGRLAIFDNWRFLHRRPKVEAGKVRKLWRGYAYETA